MGFEPAPSYEDQNALPLLEGKVNLESGALDRSAILTYKYKERKTLIYEN